MSNGKLRGPSCVFNACRLSPLDVGSDVTTVPRTVDRATRICKRIIVDRVTAPTFVRDVRRRVVVPGSAALRDLFAPRRCRRMNGTVGRGVVISVTVLTRLGPTTVGRRLIILLCVGRAPNFGPRRRLSACFRRRTTRRNGGVNNLRATRSRVSVLFGDRALRHRTDLLCYTVDSVRGNVSRDGHLVATCRGRSLSTVLRLVRRHSNGSYSPLPNRVRTVLSGHGGT